jgi:hypothetical protein
MVTMVDEIFDRQYQAGRKQLHATVRSGFARLSQAIGNAFEVLVRIEYNEPWAAAPKRPR